jgi:glucan phosphorylase
MKYKLGNDDDVDKAVRTYPHKPRKREVIFMCNKNTVLEIIEYHNRNGRFSEETITLYKELVESMGETFGYNLFMQECERKSYTPKLVRTDKEAFFCGFKHRMYKYKKGKDWKII